MFRLDLITETFLFCMWSIYCIVQLDGRNKLISNINRKTVFFLIVYYLLIISVAFIGVVRLFYISSNSGIILYATATNLDEFVALLIFINVQLNHSEFEKSVQFVLKGSKRHSPKRILF